MPQARRPSRLLRTGRVGGSEEGLGLPPLGRMDRPFRVLDSYVLQNSEVGPDSYLNSRMWTVPSP